MYNSAKQEIYIHFLSVFKHILWFVKCVLIHFSGVME
jgi:Protein of unknown function (DUF4057)